MRPPRGALPLLSLLATAHAALMDTLEPIGQTASADMTGSRFSVGASAGQARPFQQRQHDATKQDSSNVEIEPEDALTNQVIFKVSESSVESPEASLSRAVTIAGSSGLQNTKRLFRNAGKFEGRHVKFGLHLWYQGYATSAEEADGAVALLRRSDSLIATASRRPVARRTTFTPNDTNFKNQTHLKAVGMPEAWSFDAGRPEIVVAIIDSGVQEDHADLQTNKWHNAGEICGNLEDDDGNGYVDDCNGYNFAADGPELYSGDFHGTHVAGIVGADTDNNIGVAGTAGGRGGAPGIRLMHLNIFGSNGEDFSPAEALVYAADNGAAIAQNSWGYERSGYYDPSVLSAIDYFNEYASSAGTPSDGGLVVFAAGNEASNMHAYPAFYSGAIAVAATDDSLKLTSYTNFGDWVDVAAPGDKVLSTVPDEFGSYARLSGTSMASPLVSGALALFMSYAPKRTRAAYRDCLYSSAKGMAQFNPDARGGWGAGAIDPASGLATCMQALSPGSSRPPPPPALPPAPPAPYLYKITIMMYTDGSAFETSWELQGVDPDNDNVKYIRAFYSKDYFQYYHVLRLPAGSYKFTLKDTSGLCCRRRYTIYSPDESWFGNALVYGSGVPDGEESRTFTLGRPPSPAPPPPPVASSSPPSVQPPAPALPPTAPASAVPPACVAAAGRVDLQAMPEPEWCDDSQARKSSREACEAAYVTLEQTAESVLISLCEYITEESACHSVEETLCPTVPSNARPLLPPSPPPLPFSPKRPPSPPLPPPPSPPPPLPPPSPPPPVPSPPSPPPIPSPPLSPPLACELSQSRVDLGALLDPQWCNQDAARRDSKAVCENAFVTINSDGDRSSIALCTHLSEKKACVIGPVVQCTRLAQQPVSSPGCEEIASRTDLRTLPVPEWCNSDRGRRRSKAACEGAYLGMGSGADGSREIELCGHESVTQKCLARSRLTCFKTASSTEKLLPPPPPPFLPSHPQACFEATSRVDLRGLLRPQWCNNGVERRKSKAACESTFVTIITRADSVNLALCEHHADLQACYAGTITTCPLPPSTPLQPLSFSPPPPSPAPPPKSLESEHASNTSPTSPPPPPLPPPSPSAPAPPQSPPPPPSPLLPPAQPTGCEQIARRHDLRMLPVPEWCNSDEGRRNSKTACEEAYLGMGSSADGSFNIELCAHDAAANKCLAQERLRCRTGDGTDGATQATAGLDEASSFPCEQFQNMRDLRALAPKQWCYQEPARRQSRAACEEAYVTLSIGDSQVEVAPCVFHQTGGRNNGPRCVYGRSKMCPR